MMDYKFKIIDTLRQLKTNIYYKGYGYIIDAIEFMLQESQNDVIPPVKIIYIEIATKYGTSVSCVEKNIRKVVSEIWKEADPDICSKIFGDNSTGRKPCNKEFLFSLFRYIITSEQSNMVPTCSLTGLLCEYCGKFLYEYIMKFSRI